MVLGFYYILNKSYNLISNYSDIFFPETEIAKYNYSNLQEFIEKSDEYSKQLSLKGKQPDTTYKTQENSDLAVCASNRNRRQKTTKKEVSIHKKPMYRQHLEQRL